MNIERARDLRRRMTPAEARMWNLLRDEPYKTARFRRQVPLGDYFADFASHSAKLVIEVDGDTHGTERAARYDAVRDDFLVSEGYQVVRFTNEDVLRNLTGVNERLVALLEDKIGVQKNPHSQPR